MVKQCPVCGRKYTEKHNFCSKHSDLIKLVYIRDLVKICPKCGKKYTEKHNYCSKHEEAIELVYIKDLVKECRACGAKYPDTYSHCIRCEWDEPLDYIGMKTRTRIRDIKSSPNRFYNTRTHLNSFDELDELLSNENIAKLFEFKITQSEFLEIIENIKKTHWKILDNLIRQNNIYFDDLSITDKMLLYSKAFVRTDYKEGGGNLGHFSFNEISIDDRMETALQITTIIHELSHFLLSEILEQIISLILNTDKTDALEAFVFYNLMCDDFNSLMDEYCAHTVEGRFAVLGYQDYGSYKMMLEQFMKENDVEYVEVANTTGNTFAHYIKFIMESFIGEDLREEIKEEFLNFTDEKRYSELRFETDSVYEWDDFREVMKYVLTKNIDDFISSPEHIKRLYAYSIKFSQSNG